jgi:sirohydrochlorin ferrochelatase
MTTENRALIVIAHGSRRNSANDEFFQLVTNLTQQMTDYQQVLPALLEQAQPTLLQACTQAVQMGASHIDVYPLFFNKGRHVGKDIPIQVAQAIDHFPAIEINLLEYLGGSSLLSALIKEHITIINSKL